MADTSALLANPVVALVLLRNFVNTKTRVTIRNFLCFLLVGFAYPNSADLDQSSKLKRATHELITSLTDEQRPKTLLPLTDDRRATWSNLPVLMAPPTGIMLKDLSDQQRHLVHRMLRSSLSSQGYGKSAAIMWIDDILFEIEQIISNQIPKNERIKLA